MKINILPFTYLFLRLAPFVLASFFSLMSFFNQDFKGIVYLVGLLFACFVNVILGNVLPLAEASKTEICNMITINQIGEISKLPFGQAVFGYTFAYLLYPIMKFNYFKQNVNTIVFFVILILFDIIWNVRNTCYTIWQLEASLVFGLLIGFLWAYLISSTNRKNLLYISGINSKEVCSAPAAPTFKCKVGKKESNN
jgi:hypothetical protein